MSKNFFKDWNMAMVEAHNAKFSKLSSPVSAPSVTFSNKKRLRQNTGGMNRLETELYHKLEAVYADYDVRPQAIRLQLANGVTYTPDFVLIHKHGNTPIEFHECKGKHAWDDSLVKLKVAAREWHYFVFKLWWKVDGEWQTQIILP